MRAMMDIFLTGLVVWVFLSVVVAACWTFGLIRAEVVDGE